MHFLKMIKKLRDKCEPGTYAYATQAEAGWLLRMHVTKQGDPIIEYTTPCHTCEELHPYYVRVWTPSGDDMDCDWGMRIPTEWIPPKWLKVPENSQEECSGCGWLNDEHGHFCQRHGKYVSTIMGCKHFTKGNPIKMIDVVHKSLQNVIKTMKEAPLSYDSLHTPPVTGPKV